MSQLEAALASARRGFRVFPIRAYGKKPAIENFPLNATTDEAQIRQWWSYNPNYNHGILTNERVVVDADTRLGGVENFYGIGGHFDTLVVKTPTGGYHAYFDGPDSGLRVNFVPGVDIRSHNGYVLGPGSYTDVALADDPDVKATGYYEIVVDKPTVWVPLQIEAQLRPPGVRAERDNSRERDTPNAIQFATDWLLQQQPAIQGQGGDNHTYQIATKMVRDFALSVETATQLMLLHWNENCMPPWDGDELYRKVANAEEYGQSSLGAALPDRAFSGVTVLPQPAAPTAQERGVSLGNALDYDALAPRPWLVHKLLLRGDVTVMAAAGAAGKSATKLTMAAHWAVGKDFGPYKLAVSGQPLRTLIYNAEDDRDEQSRRLAAICHVYNLDYNVVRKGIAFMDDTDGELLLVAKANHTLASNDQAIKFLSEYMQDERIDVSMFDPMVNTHTAAENDNVDMRYVIATYRRLARATKTATFLAHHTGKGGRQDKGDPEAIRGAGAIVNSARIAVMLSGPSDDDRKMFGITDKDRFKYSRIDDAKANMFQRSTDAVMWLRWESARLRTGDVLGVPVPVDMDAAATAQALEIAEALHLHMIASGRGGINRAEACRVLKTHDPIYAKMAEKSDMPLRRLIERVLAKPIAVGNEHIGLILEDGDTLIKVV